MKDELEKFISHNKDMFDQQIPSPLVLTRILEKMVPKDVKKPAGLLIPLRVVRWAAACLFFIVIGATFLLWPRMLRNTGAVPMKLVIEKQSQKSKPQQIAMDNVNQELRQRKPVLAVKLKKEKLIQKKLVVIAGLHDMESTAHRITATLIANQLQNKGNEVIQALIQTLNTDPNVNVRLAALDALARFHQNIFIRHQLITTLSKQQDPVVQITMINLLIRMNESGILEELDKIVKDDNAQKTVKDCAYSGIFQLRSS